MTPEQEAKFDARFDSLHAAMTNLANNLAEHIQEDKERFSKIERFKDWTRGKFRELRAWVQAPQRERMPTLNPDDSGSIDVSFGPAKAAFKGVVPIRIAIAALVVAAAVAGGWLVHATVHPAQAASEGASK